MIDLCYCNICISLLGHLIQYAESMSLPDSPIESKQYFIFTFRNPLESIYKIVMSVMLKDGMMFAGLAQEACNPTSEFANITVEALKHPRKRRIVCPHKC